MKKKAKFLEEAINNLLNQCRQIVKTCQVTKLDAANLEGDDGITITANEALIFIEVFESLQWANIYEGEDRDKIGREFLDFETADYIGRLAEGFDYIETVGIIRLKDDEI